MKKIFNDGKIWEMRSTKTDIRGKIGLIESGSGLIVGEANLVDCQKIPTDKNRQRQLYFYHKVDDFELLKKWNWAWILNNVVKYKNPIPYQHPQGAVIWVKLTTNKPD